MFNTLMDVWRARRWWLLCLNKTTCDNTHTHTHTHTHTLIHTEIGIQTNANRHKQAFTRSSLTRELIDKGCDEPSLRHFLSCSISSAVSLLGTLSCFSTFSISASEPSLASLSLPVSLNLEEWGGCVSSSDLSVYSWQKAWKKKFDE